MSKVFIPIYQLFSKTLYHALPPHNYYPFTISDGCSCCDFAPSTATVRCSGNLEDKFSNRGVRSGRNAATPSIIQRASPSTPWPGRFDDDQVTSLAGPINRFDVERCSLGFQSKSIIDEPSLSESNTVSRYHELVEGAA
ncbi:hypothetical protein RRG08_050275 [Elysia crispata]|uniref:Uncharacterized protein n=1 Tax=Elysia crispata TaxID=231223 RepID=A0AAE1B4T1_9GAST|nr:hypothetical protein RRG08_050275 [Elysia crispata]